MNELERDLIPVKILSKNIEKQKSQRDNCDFFKNHFFLIIRKSGMDMSRISAAENDSSKVGNVAAAGANFNIY